MEANIHKFQAFVKASECGSFTKTAQELGYTQSSVSRMVQGLEEDWGVRLFERSGGAVKLTKEGEGLLPDVQNVVHSYERLQMKVDDINGLESGTVSIAAPASIISWKRGEPLGGVCGRPPEHRDRYHGDDLRGGRAAARHRRGRYRLRAEEASGRCL